jgi:hypothetical protein
MIFHWQKTYQCLDRGRENTSGILDFRGYRIRIQIPAWDNTVVQRECKCRRVHGYVPHLHLLRAKPAR